MAETEEKEVTQNLPWRAQNCFDTEGWLSAPDPNGFTCAEYAERFCQSGGARPGNEDKLGEAYNYPEDNCCACL